MRSTGFWDGCGAARPGGACRKKENGNTDSILGYEFELGEEGSEALRARRQGDWLVIYHKRLDDYLAERKTRWAETEAKRKAELAVEQEKLAPVSVEGF